MTLYTFQPGLDLAGRYLDYNFDWFPTPPPLARAAVQVLPTIPRTVLDLGAGEGAWGNAILGESTRRKMSVPRRPWVYGIELSPERQTQPEGWAGWLQADMFEGLRLHDPVLGDDPILSITTIDGQTHAIPQPQLIVSNPPYTEQQGRSRAELTVELAMSLLPPKGIALFLLRLALLEGKTRYKQQFWKANGLRDVYVLAERPVFQGDASDPRTAYGIFLCQKGYRGRWHGDFLSWR